MRSLWCAGVGLLSFPLAFTKTGFVPGTALIFLVAGLEVFTAYVLCYYAGRHRAKTYQDLVFKALGRRVYWVCIMTLVAFLFGCMIAFFIVAGDTLTQVFGLVFGPHR